MIKRTHRILTLFVLFFLMKNLTYAQSEFSTFISKFERMELPLERTDYFNSNDTIGINDYNEIIFKKQERPFTVSLDDLKVKETDYFIKLSKDPFKASILQDDLSEVEKSFYDKAYPVGIINLNKKYINPIIRIKTFKKTYVLLYSFDQDGKLLSMVPLLDESLSISNGEVEVQYVNGEINSENEIVWKSNMYGLITKRIYVLNENGIFQVKEEVKKGEAGY
jgi:hypothetical protein